MATVTAIQPAVGQIWRLNIYSWGWRNDGHQPIPFGTVAQVRVVTSQFVQLLSEAGDLVTVEPWRLQRDWECLP